MQTRDIHIGKTWQHLKLGFQLAVSSVVIVLSLLLFSMTRPTLVSGTVPGAGPVPGIVWVLLVVYLSTGLFSIWFEIRSCRRLLRQHRERCAGPVSALAEKALVKMRFRVVFDAKGGLLDNLWVGRLVTLRWGAPLA